MADEQDENGQVGQVGRVRQVGQVETNAPDGQDESLAQVETVGHEEPGGPNRQDEQDESPRQVGLVEPVGHDEQSATDELTGQDGPVGRVGQVGQVRPEDDEPGGPPVEAQPTDDAGIESDGGVVDGLRASAELKAILEALIFASPEPVTLKALFKLLDTEPKEDILAALEELKQDYEARTGGLQLVEVAGGYQIVTRSDLHEWVRRLFHERTTQKLTVQALETLAVIAYREPITAAEITDVRGVNTSGVLNTLLERHLIKIVGRKQVVGRPFMYATTKEFLIRFGLNELGDLPKVEDMAEALGLDSVTPLLVERTPSEEMLPLDEPDRGRAAGAESPLRKRELAAV